MKLTQVLIENGIAYGITPEGRLPVEDQEKALSIISFPLGVFAEDLIDDTYEVDLDVTVVEQFCAYVGDEWGQGYHRKVLRIN